MIRAVGLISGTSMDGIDAAAVEISEGSPLRVESRASLSRPYPPAIRESLATLCRSGAGLALDACRVTMVLGELFAEAALAVIEQAGWNPDQVHLIGSHGQTTVSDFGESSTLAGYRAFSTLQLGHPAVIAERTGITVVADFRARDIAAGGRGAPLAPMLDSLLYGAPGQARVLLNLGGIANLTFLPASGDPAAVIGFDTGPANMPLDLLVRRWSGGRDAYDRDGALTSGGQVIESLLARLWQHPFVAQPPPKATGSEEFGEAFIAQVLTWAPNASHADVLATLAEFTAETIDDAITRWFPGSDPLLDVVASGGGTHNPALMARIRTAVAPTPLRTLDEIGGDVDAKEAVLFAVLGYLTLHGQAGSLPSVTGAKRPVPLGSITPGALGVGWPGLGL